MDAPRYTVYDRKTSDRVQISAINPRYWVIDTATNLPVDQFASKQAARDTAADLNATAGGQ